MAVNSISGDFGFTTQLSCILKEGNITVGTGFDFMGSGTGTVSLASGLDQGEWVSLSDDTDNTYDATGGLPVVTEVSDDKHLLLGKIIDTPRWVKIPATSQTDWATMLSGGYYRVATVEVFPMMIATAKLVTANANDVIPGECEILDVDASATKDTKVLTVVDIASGGSKDIFSFHYQAKATGATVTILIGLKGFGSVGA